MSPSAARGNSKSAGSNELATWFYHLPSSAGSAPESWSESAFRLIDESSALRVSLERAGEELSAGPSPAGESAAATRLDALRMYMLQQVYFVEALARVEVARTMALRPPSQYCFQAMEGATDDLDRALYEGQQRTSAASWLPSSMPITEIRGIRKRIFTAWEAARTRDDPSMIAKLSIPSVLSEAEAGAASDPQNRRWTALHALRGLGG